MATIFSVLGKHDKFLSHKVSAKVVSYTMYIDSTAINMGASFLNTRLHINRAKKFYIITLQWLP